MSPAATVRPWRDELREIFRGELRFDEPISRHTTLRVGGPADAWAAPADADEVRALVAFAAARGVACRAVGAGSNLLVRDGGVRGLLVSVESMRRVERGSAGSTGLPAGANTVFVEAGASTGRLLQAATGWGLGGVEFLGGVPGSVGGGLVMNAGTTLGEFKDVVRWVRSVDAAGALRVRDNAACGFVYRGSSLGADEIVVDAALELRPRPRAAIEADVRALRARRREREPKGVPNAGSFFKNPPGDFAGRLIEQAGLKGRRIGGAEVSPVHANWLVNTGGARAADFLALIDVVRAEVEAKSGVRLTLEVRVVGEDEGATGT